MEAVAPHDASDEARLLTDISHLAHRFARRLAGPEAAEDLAQDVVLDCLVRIRSGRWHVQRSLEAFISAAVWRNHADALRRSGHRRARDAQHLQERAESRSSWMDPALALEERELEAARERALMTLPRACRQVYAIVREEEVSYDAVATRLGISRATVCSHVAMAQRRLRAELSAAGIGSDEPRTAAPAEPKPARRTAAE